MDWSSWAPRALSAAFLETPQWRGGKKECHTPFRVVSPFSEKIRAKSRVPAVFGICLLSGAEASILGEAPNLRRRPCLATCFAQFPGEPRTHRAPGQLASPPALLCFLNV